MDFLIATKRFERWLAEQTKLVRGDLRHKHAAMGADIFSFLRATYYRWAQRFSELDPAIAKAANVLAIGDLHVENFGTWRDAMGRLAWGINDFDEAYPLPYTNDLVRLGTSALVAIEQRHLPLKAKNACAAILDGYRQGFAAGGRPFVIGEEHRWLKPILQSPLRDPGLFWDKLNANGRERTPLPAEARSAIAAILPDPDLLYVLRHHQVGLGNLGKPRFTAIAHWKGGPVAREAKALTLSAAAWADGKTDGPYYAQILAGSIRSSDPFLQVQGKWIARRISPDNRRLELATLSGIEDKELLLHAMGFETANVHLGTSGARRSIAKHLKEFSDKQFRLTAIRIYETLEKDFRRWRKG